MEQITITLTIRQLALIKTALLGSANLFGPDSTNGSDCKELSEYLGLSKNWDRVVV